MKAARIVTLCWFIVGCGDVQTGDSTRPTSTAQAVAAGGKIFLVQLNEDAPVDATLADLGHVHGAPVVHRYHYALKGGALLVPNDAALAAIAADPRVARIEEDQPVWATGKPAAPADAGTVDAGAPPANSQVSPTGYLLIGANTLSNQGSGVRVAVLDTGVSLTHPDLAGNIETTYAKDCVNESGQALMDQNGHGSHVSGTIAAINNSIGSAGIGPQIKIVPIKVLNRNGTGSWAGIICGIDHVTANAGVLKVVNMSLGGTGTECASSTCTKSSLQLAIERSVAAGVTYAVAAGNDGLDASGSVPAAYGVVITVSAYSDADGVLGAGDGWPTFTNYGSGVDIAAPGVNIYSTWKGTGYNTISGTSMASPHVAAAAALFISTHPGASPQQVRDRLRAMGTSVYPGSTDPRHAEPLLDVRSFGMCSVTCASAAKNCGTLSDGCGGELSCGACTSPTSCGGAGSPNVCGCTPTVTCSSAGATCGAVANGCGGSVDCGSCAAPTSCGGGGAANQCGCAPLGSAAACAGKNCGTVADGCGGTYLCGTGCVAPATCSATNVCVCTPVSQSTACGSSTCGAASDGCGGSYDCGTCVAPQTCGGIVAGACG